MISLFRPLQGSLAIPLPFPPRLSLSSLGHHPIVVLDRIFYGFCLSVLFRRINQTHRLIPQDCPQYPKEPTEPPDP